MRRVLSPIPLAVIGVLAALVGLLAYGLASNEPDRSFEAAAAAGRPKPAPDLSLPRLGRPGTSTLADYRGQVVVLNFWASWCDPCRAESPLLERWHRRASRADGTVLGIDVLDVDSDAQEFIDDFNLTYPMLRDGPGDLQDDFGIVSFPETFVIDRRGRVTAVRRGTVDDEFMRRAVAPLLEESA